MPAQDAARAGVVLDAARDAATIARAAAASAEETLAEAIAAYNQALRQA